MEKYALIPFINMMLKTLNRNKYTWGKKNLWTSKMKILLYSFCLDILLTT